MVLFVLVFAVLQISLYKRIVIVIYVLNECVTKELITVSGKIMLCSFKEIPEPEV